MTLPPYITKVNRKMAKITGSQVTAARALLGLSRAELADACDLAVRTVDRFENLIGEPHRGNLKRIVAELEKRGIEFTNGTGIGLRLDFKKAEAYKNSVGASPSSPGLE